MVLLDLMWLHLGMIHDKGDTVYPATTAQECNLLDL